MDDRCPPHAADADPVVVAVLDTFCPSTGCLSRPAPSLGTANQARHPNTHWIGARVDLLPDAAGCGLDLASLGLANANGPDYCDASRRARRGSSSPIHAALCAR